MLRIAGGQLFPLRAPLLKEPCHWAPGTKKPRLNCRGWSRFVIERRSWLMTSLSPDRLRFLDFATVIVSLAAGRFQIEHQVLHVEP